MAKKRRPSTKARKTTRFRKAKGRKSIHHIELKKKKCLVVYYSRSGNTKKLAEAISIVFRCDLDEIRDAKPRHGILGFLRSGSETFTKSNPEIETSKNPSKYDVVILGTPVWMGNVSSPVRSYIQKHRKDFKKAAFFCTYGSDIGKTFSEMHRLCGKKPLAVLSLRKGEVAKGGYVQKLSEFLDEIYS